MQWNRGLHEACKWFKAWLHCYTGGRDVAGNDHKACDMLLPLSEVQSAGLSAVAT